MCYTIRELREKPIYYYKQGVEVEVYPPGTPEDKLYSRDTDNVIGYLPGQNVEAYELEYKRLEAAGYILVPSYYRHLELDEGGNIISYEFL